MTRPLPPNLDQSAEAGRLEQVLLAASIAAAVDELWARLDPAFDGGLFVAALQEIVQNFGQVSLGLAADTYNEQRTLAGFGPLEWTDPLRRRSAAMRDAARRKFDMIDYPTIAPSDSPAIEMALSLEVTVRQRSQVALVVQDATYDVLQRVDYRKEVPTAVAERNRELARAASEGIAVQRSLNQGRHLVTDLAHDSWAEDIGEPFDRQLEGWYRRTDGDPCAFCAMLASRGAVYSTRFTAGVSIHENVNLDGSYNASWHPSCGCTAVPLWSTDLDVPELNVELRDLWDSTTKTSYGAPADLSGAAARSAFRKAIAARSLRLQQEDIAPAL